MKQLTKQIIFASLIASNYCFAEGRSQATQSQTEPAAFLLLVLGLAALFLGMRNLRDLRDKKMLPPRPKPTHIKEEGEASTANEHSTISSN